MFASDNIIGLKQSGKSFPINSDIGLLRWRLQTTDEALMPLSSESHLYFFYFVVCCVICLFVNSTFILFFFLVCSFLFICLFVCLNVILNSYFSLFASFTNNCVCSIFVCQFFQFIYWFYLGLFVSVCLIVLFVCFSFFFLSISFSGCHFLFPALSVLELFLPSGSSQQVSFQPS